MYCDETRRTRERNSDGVTSAHCNDHVLQNIGGGPECLTKCELNDSGHRSYFILVAKMFVKKGPSLALEDLSVHRARQWRVLRTKLGRYVWGTRGASSGIVDSGGTDSGAASDNVTNGAQATDQGQVAEIPLLPPG